MGQRPPARAGAKRRAENWIFPARSWHIVRMQEPKHVQTELEWDALPPAAMRPALTGGIAFQSPEHQVQRTAELMGDGALVVVIPPLPAGMRGHLAEHLEEHLEKELAVRGAPSPYLAAWSAMPDDAEERLADQLFRARTTGASGIALAMGSIAAAACPALTPEDSATLRWLARATTHAPLVVLLDDADTFAGAYDAPVGLASLLDRAAGGCAKPAAPSVEPAAEREPERVEAEPREAEEEEEGAPHHDVAAALSAVLADVEEARAPEPEPEPAAEDEVVVVDAARAMADAAPEPEPREAERARAAIGVPVAGPNDQWRGWALALGAVRGPLPLAAFERLFADSYVPLANAIACGLDDPRATRAYDEFRRTFERAYTEAFAAFGATNRRPRLVMDAHDVASKQARLHNARTSHVLLIDSLRWDLGSAVRDAVAERASGSASLTGQTALWSALPTTTMRQLETIARGMDALRAPAIDDPQESLRGRSAEVVRRLRVGSREVYKLDLVPAMLASLGDEPGAEDVVGALEHVADAVADAVVRHIEALPPRTLLLVAGDHGFTVDRRGRILHGGASPEEVLVPAYAWLVGDLH